MHIDRSSILKKLLMGLGTVLEASKEVVILASTKTILLLNTSIAIIKSITDEDIMWLMAAVWSIETETAFK